LNTIIMDDEIESIRALQIELGKYCPQVQVIHTFTSAKEAILQIKEEKFDLLFLDIELGEMTGFDLLENLADYSFDIIFETAYDDFAIRAFEVAALGYLLKPFNREQLMAAVNRVEKKRISQTPAYHVLLENLRNTNNEKLIVPTEDALEVMYIQDIVYLQSENNYTRIFLKDGIEFLSSKTLKKFESILTSAGFFRCHNSYLINLKQIRRFMKGVNERLIMTNNHEVYVSRSKRNELLRIL
ncbi:MAG: LytR/AlgR family response regulator transcription factor, partial [Chitinophagaceae bacterium]